jgi:hypothetical protein
MQIHAATGFAGPDTRNDAPTLVSSDGRSKWSASWLPFGLEASVSVAADRRSPGARRAKPYAYDLGYSRPSRTAASRHALNVDGVPRASSLLSP